MTEAATEEEVQDPDLDQALAVVVAMIAEAGDTPPALAPETDAAIAAAIPVTEAAAETKEEEADPLKREAPREALLLMREKMILSPQVTTSESDL